MLKLLASNYNDNYFDLPINEMLHESHILLAHKLNMGGVMKPLLKYFNYKKIKCYCYDFYKLCYMV